ncbi:MAG: alpha/beta hydrolase-fold protein [Bacteroidia bacterium]
MKTILKTVQFKSAALDRGVNADIIMPAHLDKHKDYPLLILNDGQDMQPMNMKHIMEEVWKKNVSKPFIIVAPYAKHRLEEYGVANNLDFKHRGKMAANYTTFITYELLPQLMQKLAIKEFEEIAIGGFSLGGLSAFDIAWNNPDLFTKVCVCSGSFWWRRRDLRHGYTDADRIMHNIVRNTIAKPELKIWFECGTLDETMDRNNNDIIDSIDDTLDLITELELKGFERGVDIFYNEVIAGKHTLETYGMVLPYFFNWAFKG